MDIMLKQIYLDTNMNEGHPIKDDIWIAPTRVLPGSRVIHKLDPFFRVIVFMGRAYVMADEETIPGWEEILKDYPAEWFFNYGRLRKIDRILNEFDREIIDTHLYYLPDMDAPHVDIPDDWKVFSKEEIGAYKEINPFHNALPYSPTQPDVVAVAVPDGQGGYKGMAGASKDGEYVLQIGIDVKDEYRGEGLATGLVSALRSKIIDDGMLPFYGTSESHALSRTVGVKSGFLPAFSEVFVGKIVEELDGIYN